jgi:hypothetical protein
MQIPWKRAAIAVLVVLVLIFVFFIRRRTERLEVKGQCTSQQDEIDGKCYERCREGFSAKGANCYEVCKPEEKSEGMTCISNDGTTRNINSYTRQEIVYNLATEADIQKFNPDCSDKNYEAFGTFCAEKCKEGFTKFSVFCMGTCPTGTEDMGIECADATKSTIKESYIPKTMFSAKTDTSNIMACVDGYKRFDAMCVQNCSPDHELVGAFCVEKCKSGETDLGTMCLKGQTTRKKDIMTPGISEVPIKT